MKRVLKAILILLCALTLAFSGAVTAFAQEGAGAENAAAQESAAPAANTQAGSGADTNTAAQADESDPAAGGSFSLFLPASSEQYLPLENPTDYAINENYIAVAEEDAIYLFDRSDANGTYKRFTAQGYTVGTIGFYTANGEIRLYFTANHGSANRIQYIDCTAADFAGQTPTQTQVQSCNSFVINGDTICYVNAEYHMLIGSVSQLESSAGTELYYEAGINQISFAAEDDTIYFSASNESSRETQLRSVKNGQLESTQINIEENISSFAMENGACLYIASGSLWRRSADGAVSPVQENGEQIKNVSRVHRFGDTLYLISGNAVRSFTENGFGDWSVTRYSSGENRLGEGAKGLSLCGERLVIADPANARVLLYDKAAQTYSAIAVTDLGSSFFVCAGKKNFLVSNGSSIRMFSYGGEAIAAVPQDDKFDGNITDIAYSYGAYYLLTNSNATYRVTEEGITNSGHLKTAYTSITADIEGNILALSSNNTVDLFTEENFLAEDAAALEEVNDFGTAVTDILVDYAGNVYGLTADGILRNGTGGSETPLDLSSYVSFADGAKAVSFAFGFETGDAYILTDAGFIVKWSGGIESLDNIAESGTVAALAQNTLTSSLPQDLLVTIEAGAVLVPLDTARLAEGEPLPANGYERTSEARIAVNVHAVQGGAVVALYRYASGKPQSVREYSLCFLPNGQSMQPLEQNGYYTENKTGVRRYTTNAVCLYTLPLMRQFAGARTQLPRGAAVTVLGTLSCPAADGGWGLDTDYCFVSYTFEQGTEYGFVPASYCSETAASGGAGTEQISYRRVKKGERIELCALNNAQDTVVLEQEEQVTVHGEADGNGLVYVTYTAEEVTYGGWVLEELLADASNFGTWVLVAVAIVTAAVLASTCYLFLRKQPMVAPPVPAEEAADGADENDGGEDGDDGGDPNGDPAPPDGQ